MAFVNQAAPAIKYAERVFHHFAFLAQLDYKTVVEIVTIGSKGIGNINRATYLRGKAGLRLHLYGRQRQCEKKYYESRGFLHYDLQI